MRNLWAAGALAIATATAPAAWAADDEGGEGEAGAEAEASVDAASLTAGSGEFHPFVIGAFMSMGAALTIGDVYYGANQTPRFAGSGGAYFNYYFTPLFAIEAGLGFVGKGYRSESTAGGEEVKYRFSYIDLEIPLGAKLSVSNFQVSLAVAIDLIVSAKCKAKYNGEWHDTPVQNGEDDPVEKDDYRVFNLGPKVAAGYAIALGPVYLVPGISWSMDVIDVTKIGGSNQRGMNAMIVVAGEFGFGGGGEE